MVAKKLLIHLPTVGKPYIITNKDSQKLDDLQELVAYPGHSGGFPDKGTVEMIDSRHYLIHPMFVMECESWAVAHHLYDCDKTKTVINDNGINLGYIINAATIRKGFTPGSCPHLVGEVYMICDKKSYDKICGKLNHKLKECDFNKDIYSDDDEEEDEEEEIKK